MVRGYVGIQVGSRLDEWGCGFLGDGVADNTFLGGIGIPKVRSKAGLAGADCLGLEREGTTLLDCIVLAITLGPSLHANLPFFSHLHPPPPLSLPPSLASFPELFCRLCFALFRLQRATNRQGLSLPPLGRLCFPSLRPVARYFFLALPFCYRAALLRAASDFDFGSHGEERLREKESGRDGRRRDEKRRDKTEIIID